jgi:hypothetical protein
VRILFCCLPLANAGGAQSVQEGRKMDAVLIMRKCHDMTLKEQKMIAEAIQKSF